MHRRIVSSSTQHGRSFRLFQKSLFSSSLSSSSERHVEVVRKHLLNLHSAMGRLKDGRDEAMYAFFIRRSLELNTYITIEIQSETSDIEFG